MKIELLSFKKDKNKFLWCIMLGAVTVAFTLICTTMYYLNDKTGGINISDSDSKDQMIFKLNSYITEYNVNVTSNKNINKYKIKEEYERKQISDELECEENFKFLTTNEIGEEIRYEIGKNKLSISSKNQISSYILSDYIVKKENVFSLSTFISIYNDIDNINKDSTLNSCAKVETEEYDNKVLYRIILPSSGDGCEVCTKYNELLSKGIAISKLELIVTKDTGKPVEYLVYNKENNAYIDITYEYFEPM